MSYCELTSENVGAKRPVWNYLRLFILVAMLRESLRLPIMDGFATTAWRYSLVSDTPRVIMFMFICGVAMASPRPRRWWVKVLIALIAAMFLQFVVQSFINEAFGRVLKSIAYLSHDEVYKVPYGWQIELPAYITYMEPVIACFLMVRMVWDKLTGSLLQRTSQFIFVVLLVDNALIRPFVYIFYSNFNWVVSLLSMGQFSLETLALAFLTTVNWRWCQPQSAPHSFAE